MLRQRLQGELHLEPNYTCDSAVLRSSPFVLLCERILRRSAFVFLLSSVWKAAGPVCRSMWPVFKIQPMTLLRVETNTCVWLTLFVCVLLQLASGIYSFACSLWSHHTDCFLQQIYARDEAAALGSLERTLLSLKGITCIHTHPAFSAMQGNNVLIARYKNFSNTFLCVSLSVLRKLTVHGFQEPQQNVEVMVGLSLM